MMIMTLIAALTAQLAWAGDEEGVTAMAKRNFEKEFPGALYVKWEKLERTDACMVRFVYNDQALLSYFNDDGNMIATIRNVEKQNLPFRISETLFKKYKDYKVLRIEELIMGSDVSYLAELENEKSKLHVRLYNSGMSHEMKKEKKKSEKKAD
jgi:hypothetical protein